MEQERKSIRMKLARPTPELRRTAEERRLQPMLRALKAIHSASNPESMEPEDLERQRVGQEVLGRLVAPMLGMTFEPFDLAGMNAAWVRPDRGHDRRRAILYCHGGGYTSGNLGYSRPLSAKLSSITGWQTLSFEYRLAPEHPFPAAIDDAMKAWDYLMYLGYGAHDIVVAGDSAGGNMALVLCHQLKAAGRKLPGRLVLMSPWTDMTASGKSYTERADIDPTITIDYIKAVRGVYARDNSLTSPLLSPLFGDFSDFPPTLIQVGSNEILLSDSVRLRDRMLMAQVPCKLEVWSNMWHIFQMYPLKRAGEAMESIGRFLLEQF